MNIFQERLGSPIASFYWPSQGGNGVSIYPTIASFPVSAITGTLAVAADTGILYEYYGGAWVAISEPGDVLSLGNLDAQAGNAKGASLVSGVLSMQSASASYPGLVTLASQTWGGTKTFNLSPIVPTAKAYTNNTFAASTAFTQAAIEFSMAYIPLSGITGGTYSFDSQGSACVINVTASGGAITAATVISGGSGFLLGDIITCSSNGGNGDGYLLVTGVSGTAVTTLSVLYGGTGYVSGTGGSIAAASTTPYTFALAGTLISNATFVMTYGSYITTGNQWIFYNNTTGAFTVTVKMGNGSGVAIGTGVVIPQSSNNNAGVLVNTDGVTDVWYSNNGDNKLITNVSNNASYYPVIVSSSATGVQALDVSSPFVFNPSLNGGSIGIGATPTSKFQINDSTAQTVSYTSALINANATSSTASINKIGLDVESTGAWNGSPAVNTGLVVNVSGGTTNYAATFSGGNIGVGTTAPTYTIEVQKTDANGSIGVSNLSSTAARAPSVNVKNYTGGFSGSSSQINVFASRGSSAAPTPVQNGDFLGTVTGFGQYDTTSGHFASAAVIYFLAEGTFSSSSIPGAIAFSTSPSTGTTPMERMRITNGGMVGIGVSAPTSLLQMNDSSAQTVSYTSALINANATSSTASINKIGLDIESTGTWNGTTAVNIGLKANATGGTVNYAALFSGGNVGIGTSAPTVPLSVGPNPAAAFDGAEVFQVGNTGTSSVYCTVASGGSIRMLYGCLNGVGALSGGFVGTLSNNRFNIRSNNTERMVVDTTGYVGIGLTSPSYTLHSKDTLAAGTAGGTTGILNLLGTTSGVVSTTVQAAAGTYNFNLPTTAGSTGQVLTSAGGGSSAMTWSSGLVTSLTGDVTGTASGASIATTAAATQANIVTLSKSTGVAVHGSNTNDAASAGYVGELINANVARSSFISLSANTAANITSISLTAGDWDIRGAGGVRTQNTMTQINVALNTTSASLGTGDSYANFGSGLGVMVNTGIAILAANDYTLALPTSRVSLSSTTTIYLVMQTDTAQHAYGYVEARRVR